MTTIGTLLLLLGAALGVFGVTELDSAPEIVGGDAFNYIIGAIRGVGWIAAGGVSALVGVGVLILDRHLDADAARQRAANGAEDPPERSPFAISQD